MRLIILLTDPYDPVARALPRGLCCACAIYPNASRRAGRAHRNSLPITLQAPPLSHPPRPQRDQIRIFSAVILRINDFQPSGTGRIFRRVMFAEERDQRARLRPSCGRCRCHWRGRRRGCLASAIARTGPFRCGWLSVRSHSGRALPAPPCAIQQSLPSSGPAKKTGVRPLPPAL